MAREMIELLVNDVTVGDRHRKELGDVAALAESIRRVGLLHPLVVRVDDDGAVVTMIAGARRLAAVKLLGWKHVPVIAADDLDTALLLLTAERDENACRKELLPTEAVALAEAIRPLEEARAEEHQASTRAKPGQKIGKAEASRPRPAILRESPNGGLPQGGGNLPPPYTPGKVREKIAAAVGMSGRTLEKAAAVVAAAQAQPVKHGDLPQKMDSTGSVDGAYQELRRREDPMGYEEDGLVRLDRGLEQVFGAVASLRTVKARFALTAEAQARILRAVADLLKLVGRRLPAPKTPKTRNAAPDPRLRELVSWWVDEHKRRVGAPYVVHGGADGKAIKTMLAALDRDGEADAIERFKKAAARFFGDPYHADHGGYTLRTFGSAANRYFASKGKSHAGNPTSQSAGRSSRGFDLADPDKFKGRPDDPTV